MLKSQKNKQFKAYGSIDKLFISKLANTSKNQ